MVRTLEAPDSRLRLRLRRGGDTSEALEGWLSRATVIDVGQELAPAEAAAWLEAAGESELADGLAVLNRAVEAYRVASADPELAAVDRRQAVSARVGYGAGDEVADGRWSAARELPWRPAGRRRRRMLAPEGRLAAILTGRERVLVSEELVLRARADVDAGRTRHAALQLLVALDAAIAELSAEPAGPDLDARLDALRAHREPVGAAAQAALAGELDGAQVDATVDALQRVEAALRARTAARS